MHDPNATNGSGFDREAEADMLATRLREAEDEVARERPGTPARVLARQRLEVLLGELEVATRRWAAMPQVSDPKPNRHLDERLRRLARARLESERQIERARRLLDRLRDEG